MTPPPASRRCGGTGAPRPGGAGRCGRGARWRRCGAGRCPPPLPAPSLRFSPSPPRRRKRGAPRHGGGQLQAAAWVPPWRGGAAVPLGLGGAPGAAAPAAQRLLPGAGAAPAPPAAPLPQRRHLRRLAGGLRRLRAQRGTRPAAPEPQGRPPAVLASRRRVFVWYRTGGDGGGERAPGGRPGVVLREPNRRAAASRCCWSDHGSTDCRSSRETLKCWLRYLIHII